MKVQNKTEKQKRDNRKTNFIIHGSKRKRQFQE